MKCKAREKPMRERTLLYVTEIGFEAQRSSSRFSTAAYISSQESEYSVCPRMTLAVLA